MKTNHRLPMLLSLLLLATGVQEASAFYNPQTGRWLSRDPIGEQGGANLYNFVSANPVSRTDRLGLFRDDWMTCPCTCVSVSVNYNPGGNTLQVGWYQSGYDTVFGSKINVVWRVTGNRNDCRFFQDETGTTSILTGPGVNMTTRGKNSPVSQIYTDYMGARFPFVFPMPPTAKYHLDVTWRVTFRCISSDDGPVVEQTDSADINQDFNYP